MTTTSSAFELIGAWMAMELELPVVEPALVNLSPEFIDTVREGKRAAQQSQGLNFGSKYQPGFTSVSSALIPPNEKFVETMKLIYVFDLFIANSDRGHQRPNVQFNGSNLLIFDHELAFSFLRIIPSLRNKTPWILNELDRDLYEQHFFYKPLKELKPDLTHQVSMLRRFDRAFWHKLFVTLPSDWNCTEIRDIQVHLCSILNNLPQFTKSLNKTLTA